MTIIYDDNGIKVDYFEKLFNTFEKVGIKTSGGVDSTACLYFAAKSIDELNLHDTHSLHPVYGKDKGVHFPLLGYVYNKKIGKRQLVPYDHSYKYFKIISFIRSFFPRVKIDDPCVIEFEPDYSLFAKSIYLKPTIDKLLKDDIIEVIISGSTCAPRFDNIDLGHITDERDYSYKKNQIDKGPWVTIDKKFLAYQYQKYGLMETLYPLTVSCLQESNPLPCKKCDWCKEKMWAFGSYDGGIQ
jgi:hypothetical protein